MIDISFQISYLKYNTKIVKCKQYFKSDKATSEFLYVWASEKGTPAAEGPIRRVIPALLIGSLVPARPGPGLVNAYFLI
jgi:hypothetical protein